MLARFIALLAAVHVLAFFIGAAVLGSPYLMGAGVFMALVLVGALWWGRRPPKQGPSAGPRDRSA